MTAWPAVTSKSLHSSISSYEYWGVKKLCPGARGSLKEMGLHRAPVSVRSVQTMES